MQFGGQTPLNLAASLHAAGVPIMGTPPEAIDLAEDRDRFGEVLRKLDIPAPANGSALARREALSRSPQSIGYPVVVRPSYVLGGRAMAIVDDEEALRRYMVEAVAVSMDKPILIDQFLEDAFEVDVDAICDGERVVVGGIMQHIEEAGIHSGDSACVLPPYKISNYHLNIIREYTQKLGMALRRARSHERAVRHQGRRGLRAGGQSARQPHCPVRQQGHRRTAGEDRGQGHGRHDAWRNWVLPAIRNWKVSLSKRLCCRGRSSLASTRFWVRRCGPQAR